MLRARYPSPYQDVGQSAVISEDATIGENAGRGEPREGTEDLEATLRANQPPPFQPAWLGLSFSRPRLLYAIPLVLCEHPRHPTLAKERYRVIGVRSDQNVLVVNQAD